MANRVILGKGRGTGGSDYGLWISKPGKEVLTCDPEDLMFDSNDLKFMWCAYISGYGFRKMRNVW